MHRFGRLLVCALAFFMLASFAHAGAKRKPKVVVLHAVAAANTSWAIDVQTKIASSGLFTTVDRIDVRTGTPALPVLLQYDAALVFSDANFSDAAALGNVLADYVDAGGGAVASTFANASVGITGRWATGGYRVIDPAGQTQPTASLGTIANQNHAIVIGVTALSATSAFQSSGAVLPGNTLVASWSTGGPLVATSNTFPGRADLNFFPPSNDVRADFWNSAGDGTKLMVNALLYVVRPRVLLAGSESDATWIDDVKTKVRGTGLVGIADTFNMLSGTPTLAQLQNYDAVLAWTDAIPSNQIAVGNVLADYVDSGGGVVSAVFAQDSSFKITGRWTPTYELITPSAFSITGTATLGAVAYAGHPAMTSVASFNGGTSSYRPSVVALNPGAFGIASWSDGKPLVVASTKLPNRLDLTFYPVSSTKRADFWTVGTNGDRLLANALVYVCKPYVLLAAADPLAAADVPGKLTSTRRFSKVDIFDANTGTPSASVLLPYNAVATWSNSGYSNQVALGNNLADFVDAGGGVVAALFANAAVSAPQGRWTTQGYEITPSPLPGFLTSGQQFLGAVLEPGHPINSFVRRFDGAANSWRQNATPLLRGRTIMRWTDGKMLTSVHNFRKRADLGYWPVSNNSTNGWNQRTDGTWMTANALEFVVRIKPCPGDFNGDGQVDDSDFVLFATYYDALVDPRGDLNGDGLTEDIDFVIFANGYDALVCP